MKVGDRVTCRGASPLAGTRGVREVRAAGDGDSIRKADVGFMLPVVLNSAPGEGLRSWLVIPSWQSTVGCASRQGCRGGLKIVDENTIVVLFLLQTRNVPAI